MKAIWSGSISFGLVAIPVYAYSAIAHNKIKFRTLCGKCHIPLHYKRWCDSCKKDITWDNTVKGFKQADDTFFILSKEALKKLKPEKSDMITITEFVDSSEIDTLFIENHYYLTPTKENNKAFFLFLHALKKSNRMAVGQFTMHEKEYVVAIQSYKNVLLLNTLYYEYEVRSAELLIKNKATAPNKNELSLALQLIDKLSHKNFQLSRYKDTFLEQLKKALKVKKRNTKTKLVRKKIQKRLSISDSLKESLRKENRV